MKSYLALALICGVASAIPLKQNDIDVDVVCPPPSEDGLAVFVAHPYECNKYFVCQAGFPGPIGPLSCPGDLQFDPTLNICNFAWAVHCVNTPYPTQPTTPEPEITSSPVVPHSSTMVAPSGKTRQRPHLLQHARN